MDPNDEENDRLLNLNHRFMQVIKYPQRNDWEKLLKRPVFDSLILEKKVKKIFVVMGEAKSTLFLVQKIRDNFGIETHAPERGDVVELPC